MTLPKSEALRFSSLILRILGRLKTTLARFSILSSWCCSGEPELTSFPLYFFSLSFNLMNEFEIDTSLSFTFRLILAVILVSRSRASNRSWVGKQRQEENPTITFHFQSVQSWAEKNRRRIRNYGPGFPLCLRKNNTRESYTYWVPGGMEKKRGKRSTFIPSHRPGRGKTQICFYRFNM